MNDKLLSLIGLFYDCAVDPAQWASVLEKMGDELGGVSLVMSAVSNLAGLKFWATSLVEAIWHRGDKPTDCRHAAPAARHACIANVNPNR